MLDYVMILSAVVMFGVQFLFNARYQRSAGNTLLSTMVFSVLAGAVGMVGLLLINGCSLSVTPFTFLMAALSALNSLAFSYCAIQALGKINLSLFSVFSMIGGMLLPFAAGLLFFGEKMTVAKGLCFAIVAIGMLFTIRKGEKGGAYIYYIGVFVFNGLSGVFSMMYQKLPYAHGTAADYSILSGLLKLVIALAILGVLVGIKKQKIRLSLAGGFDAAACGLLSAVANWLLLLSLVHVDGSLQYPLVTGGVMIVSTVIGFFTKKKPEKRDCFAVGVTFIGLLALLLPV